MKTGDVVQLISGGPNMTVAAVTSAKPKTFWYPDTIEQIHCEWFDYKGVNQWDWFRPDMLKIVSPTS